jgi:hypothetical protein
VIRSACLAAVTEPAARMNAAALWIIPNPLSDPALGFR